MKTVPTLSPPAWVHIKMSLVQVILMSLICLAKSQDSVCQLQLSENEPKPTRTWVSLLTT